MQKTITPCHTNVKKYRCNWEIFVTADEEDVFKGQILVSLDGLEDEDREEYEKTLNTLLQLETIEQIEIFMESEFIRWNCLIYDYRK